MTSFTFTSEDLEKVNANKSEENKVFTQLENVRVVHTLMNPDGTPNWGQVEQDFMQDVTRGVPVIFKNGDKPQIILNTDNIGSNKERAISLVEKRLKSLGEKDLSEQQLNDFKFMTNQANIGSIAGDFVIYFNNQDIFQDAEKRAQYIQNVGGGLVQLEISKVPPDNQEHLTYKTATKITFDKDKNKCHYSGYGMCASYEIASKDSMIIIAEVDLGPLGSEKYIPKTSCSILAEGKIAEQILGQIKSDIPIPKNPQSKSYKKIEAAYKEIAVKTLQDTGYEKQFKETVKSDIELILSTSRLSDNPDNNKSKLGAIKEFKSTPKLFAEVLVDKIDEALKQDTPQARKEAIQALSNNASQLFDQPRGYMNILINNIARDRATKAGQELPKEKFIQRVKDKLNLIFAKFQSKTASQNIKIIREANNKAKSQGQSR